MRKMTDAADPWTSWLDRYGAALIMLARQRVANRADAEDVVQEAFVRFWRSRERVEQPVAYLFACVRRCAIDHRRGRQRQLKREAATARWEAESLFVTPLEHDERRLAIETAVRGLPEEQAEVLVMRIWGELSFAQIGAALETSINTVASRYRYALSKLREQLPEESIR